MIATCTHIQQHRVCHRSKIHLKFAHVGPYFFVYSVFFRRLTMKLALLHRQSLVKISPLALPRRKTDPIPVFVRLSFTMCRRVCVFLRRERERNRSRAQQIGGRERYILAIQSIDLSVWSFWYLLIFYYIVVNLISSRASTAFSCHTKTFFYWASFTRPI